MYYFIKNAANLLRVLPTVEEIFSHSKSFLLIHINRCTIRKDDAIGGIEGLEIDFAHTDAEADGNDGTQQFAVPARIERGRRQFVPTLLRLSIDSGQAAHLPDNVVGGLTLEPQLQHATDTETLALRAEEAPRALQHPPEPHEAVLSVFKFHHN